jgi:hypothetical protein
MLEVCLLGALHLACVVFFRLSVVAHAYKLSHLGGNKGRSITVWGWPGQKQMTLNEKQTEAKRAGNMTPNPESKLQY